MSTPNVSATEVKACCSAAYSSATARFLFGDRLHPGGARLTGTLLDALGLGPGSHLVDIASGTGASALQAAAYGAGRVTGIELASQNVAAAADAATAAGVDGRVAFVVGDAEALPLGDRVADAVLCECALCTFPHKDAAIGEIARVLRSGARLALSDMTADPARLPDELLTLTARVACIAAAEPLPAVVARLERAGLVVESTDTHDDDLLAMLERVEARLTLARLAGGDVARLLGGAASLIDAARGAIRDGALGYASLIARRP